MIICTKNRIHYFGKVENVEVQLSAIGKLAYQFLAEIAEPKPRSISTIIISYQYAITKHVRKVFISFEWRSRFLDHITRNDIAYHNIRNYLIKKSI